MKHIKRLLALLLIAAMVLAALAACATEEPMESAGEVSDFSSEKHFDINDILQNGNEPEESGTIGAESTENPSVSTDESSAGTTSEPVSQEQSGDETPPEESTASKPEESHGASSNQSTESTNTPSQGTASTPSQSTTSQSSEASQGTSKPAETSQGTTSQPSGGQPTGELVVSDKKYTYNGNDLMLLHVENKTALHLNVTIKGKYLDKSGKVLKEESQTYYAFPSGWSNYFIFRPKMIFDSFDYTLEVKEFKSTTTADKLYSYNGDPLTKYMELTYSKNLTWREIRYDSVAWLEFNYEVINRHPSVPLSVQFHVLILDEHGNIYMTDYELNEAWFGNNGHTGTICDPIGGIDDGKAPCTLMEQPIDADRTIPSNVQGKLTAIFAIEEVMDFNEVRNQLQ